MATASAAPPQADILAHPARSGHLPAHGTGPLRSAASASAAGTLSGQQIVVGFGGTGGWQTLAWAVAEAAVTGGRLSVWYVCPPDSLLGQAGRGVPMRTLELAAPALSRAVAAARQRLGEQRVDLVVQSGRVGATLLRAAEHADLLVVGAPEQLGWAERRSTTHQVVTHASGPVVVVRPTVTPVEGPFTGNVVIGVDGSEPARAALEYGFCYAAAHRRPVAAVHVGAHTAGDLWLDDATDEPHLAAEPADLALLHDELEPWRRRYPQVAVRRAIFAGTALQGLLRAASGARLVVVGNRGRSAAVRMVLGSVSHGAVDHAPCPVAVVPATAGRVPAVTGRTERSEGREGMAKEARS
ncbi:MAG TPA: universal stress protein [Micromonosporaceae bacterium]|nr:universal stress protein [Micromonosporaceae bacterium]